MCIDNNAIIALPSEVVFFDQSALYIIWFLQQLVAACSAGDVETVQRLLSLGVNVNDTDEVHACAYVSSDSNECEDLTSQSTHVCV